MPRRFLLPAFIALLFAVTLSARAPSPRKKATTLPVGKWQVKFTNGVMQTSEIGKDGYASVVEPLRRSTGKAKTRGRSASILFKDARAGRGTLTANEMIVEHWCPASDMPRVKPAVGKARRVP